MLDTAGRTFVERCARRRLMCAGRSVSARSISTAFLAVGRQCTRHHRRERATCDQEQVGRRLPVYGGGKDLRSWIDGEVLALVPLERRSEPIDGGSGITFLLWHIARHHDLAINAALLGARVSPGAVNQA